MSAIVNSYIKNGEPVSSKSLCDILEFELSPATLRNEMAELTELGLLEQPHTSAGRVPSYKGYRLYINKLMNKKNVSKKTRTLVDNSLRGKIDTPENLLNEASEILANITNFVVVSTTLPPGKTVIEKIQLVKTGKCTAMVVLTTSLGIVKNRIFRCNFEITQEILNLFYRVLNQVFSGVFVLSVTPEFIKKVLISLGEISWLMADALLAVLEITKSISKMDVHLGGQTNLLFIPEFQSQQALKIIKFLKHTGYIEDLLMQLENNTTVMIGRENPYEELIDSSFITTRYCVNGKEFGSIGIIGPTRMDYGSLIADVEYIAAVVGNLLSNILGFDD
ncbi:MAG: Heat-inducible transcription repressor HrcA [Eubacteriales bacterium SKADARSKE-1]|nr:Heat-inducible transcription repressor HrcA [Eubacteriales bacterium SKADARSKE-1]